MIRRDFPQLRSITFLLLTSTAILCGGCTSGKTNTISTTEFAVPTSQTAVNINTADADELRQLPHVGPALAEKIIEHRKCYGPFRRVEHLLMVEGVSDRRFREIRRLIRIE
jgi:competence ComEA-like helix-hairpin-helix protein